MPKYSKVEDYIADNQNSRAELLALREIFLGPNCVEEVKWGIPVYTVNKKNVAGFAAFKNFTSVWFYQGVFLSDPANVLINAQEGKTQALRQWRFEDVEDINKNRDLLASYMDEAIQNQIAGKELKPQRDKPVIVPNEMRDFFAKKSGLEQAFESLTKGKKRDYAEYISEAKRAETKVKRLEKIAPMILAGAGLHDKYK